MAPLTNAFGAVFFKSDLSEFALPPASVPVVKAKTPLWSDQMDDVSEADARIEFGATEQSGQLATDMRGPM